MADADLSPVAALVRRHDPDRFLTALFAPAERREALFTLYAFNHELARAREAVSEPVLALIRLQWWREVIEGMAKRHEVATPLSGLLERGVLSPGDLLPLVDAREVEADPAIATLAEWRAWLLAGAGGLAVAAGRVLGADDAEALRPLGAAYGVAGVLRSVPVLARAGRCLLPLDVLGGHGLTAEAAIAAPDAPAVGAVRRALAREGALLLDAARGVRLPRGVVAAALPAVLARRDLRRPDAPAAPRGAGDRLAVMWAGVTGRLG
jgi:phytoene synthase